MQTSKKASWVLAIALLAMVSGCGVLSQRTIPDIEAPGFVSAVSQSYRLSELDSSQPWAISIGGDDVVLLGLPNDGGFDLLVPREGAGPRVASMERLQQIPPCQPLTLPEVRNQSVLVGSASINEAYTVEVEGGVLTVMRTNPSDVAFWFIPSGEDSLPTMIATWDPESTCPE